MGFRDSDPAAAGQSGDMFGAVNSLFSGLAFCGIVYTLLQQNKQIDISQRAARVDSFLFMAELQYRLMNDAPDRRQAPFKASARYCLSRSIDLMRSLNEEFPGESDNVIGTAFYSKSDYALVELVETAKVFIESVTKTSREHASTMTAFHATHLMQQDMSHWIDRYSDYVNSGAIKNVLAGFDDMSGQIHTRPEPDDPEYETRQQQWNALWNKFEFAIFALQQNIGELLRNREPAIDMKDFMLYSEASR